MDYEKTEDEKKMEDDEKNGRRWSWRRPNEGRVKTEEKPTGGATKHPEEKASKTWGQSDQ